MSIYDIPPEAADRQEARIRREITSRYGSTSQHVLEEFMPSLLFIGCQSTVKTIGLERNRKTPMDSRIMICSDCGSPEISITEDSIRCKRCGWEDSLESVPRLRFLPGEMVRVVDAGSDSGPTYKIEKVNQGADGVMRYIMKCESTPITLMYSEDSGSRLERA